MTIFNQAQALFNFTRECRPRFNYELLNRNDFDIVQDLVNVIKSCEMERFYTIKVNKWYTIENPIECEKILKQFEAEKRERTKAKNEENPYDYLQMKDTVFRILVIEYYVACKGEELVFPVYIQVPRYVDKYYFKIQGIKYIPMYQIVDSSTYNNATSASKKKNVTLRTVFHPLRIYRNEYTNMETVDGTMLKSVHYVARVFEKSVAAFKYTLSKYGLRGTLSMLGIDTIIFLDHEPQGLNNHYIIHKHGTYICVPKYLYDNDHTIQSLVYTIYRTIQKNTRTQELFDTRFWVASLGSEFSKSSLEKGEKIQESIEGIYDLDTKDNLRLADDKKADIYNIITWMITNFNPLMLKDNLDVSIKQVIVSKYIAALYAPKIANAIRRLSKMGKKISVKYMKTTLTTQPDYLLRCITKSTLINYSSSVNDLDAMYALKYSSKPSSTGNGKTPNVLEEQRRVHPSHIGILDMDSSGNSDPGMSGIICPLSSYNNGFFSDFQEPDTWDDQINKLMADYKAVVGMREVVVLHDKLLGGGIDTEYLSSLEASIDALKNLIEPVKVVDNTCELKDIYFEDGGIIYGYE